MHAQDMSEREAETALVTLMNYEKFDLIKVLLRNQLTIVWCTRLANAQDDDEKMRIEVRFEHPPTAPKCHLLTVSA